MRLLSISLVTLALAALFAADADARCRRHGRLRGRLFHRQAAPCATCGSCR